MQSHSGVGDSINSYALVSYIPGPLGIYLDRIRRELVSSCVAQSHVSILPPRPLTASPTEVKRELADALQEYPPFSLDLGPVEIFESTFVIYLAVSSGAEHLKGLHDRLNRGTLTCCEFHSYHPHVTLAQDFPADQLREMADMARARWREFQGLRTFEVNRLTFVQNTSSNRWMDLADIPLGRAVLSGR